MLPFGHELGPSLLRIVEFIPMIPQLGVKAQKLELIFEEIELHEGSFTSIPKPHNVKGENITLVMEKKMFYTMFHLLRWRIQLPHLSVSLVRESQHLPSCSCDFGMLITVLYALEESIFGISAIRRYRT